MKKHNLKMRPIYHYKPERVHTHIAMCCMTFALLKLVQAQTQLTQPRLIMDKILEILLNIQFSVYVDSTTNTKYKVSGH